MSKPEVPADVQVAFEVVRLWAENEAKDWKSTGEVDVEPKVARVARDLSLNLLKSSKAYDYGSCRLCGE